VKQQWRSAVDSVVNSGVFIGGPTVDKFERSWAEYVGTEGCVGVGNGLDALTIALRSVGVRPGDQVAVPAHTFIASWLAVINIGAIPVGVDVDERGQLDLDLLETTECELKAVMPVHLHGMTVNMPRLMKWAEAHDVRVVEDCAQAHGAFVDGRHVGSWGHAAAFSFYPTKNLGALGDAGAVVSSDSGVLEFSRRLANYGASESDKYLHVINGVNSRLDPMQAAILSVNIELLDDWNQRRVAIADSYIQALEALPDVGSLLCDNKEDSVWHHFVVLSQRRDELRRNLHGLGVSTEIHYPHTAAHEISQICHDKVNVQMDFPIADRLSKTTMSLPLNQWLSDEQIAGVVAALARI